MNFDLAAIDTKSLSDSGVDMTVKKLNSDEPLLAKNGKPVAITVLGPDSEVYRSYTRKQVQKRLARSNDVKKLATLDLEEADAEALELMVSCTVGWKNVFDTDGKEIAFTKDAARALYEAYPIVREQVDLFIVDRTHFIKASSEN